MNKHLKFLAALTLAFSLAACTPINNSGSTNKEDQSQETNKDTNTDSANKDSSSTDSSNKEENKDENKDNTSTDSGKDDSTNTENSENKDGASADSSQNNGQEQNNEASSNASNTASAIAGKLEQSYQEQGFATSTIDYDTSDTGNSIASFSAQANGYTVYVDVTSAVNNQAQDVFDANSQNDMYGDLTIMNEWADNDNIVRVIRDNMSNANFVEVLDLHQQTAIHIYDETPEQLTNTLTVLQSVGYPVEL